MNITDLLDELKTAGLIDRVRRVKLGDSELELSAPVDTDTKIIELKIPESQTQGDPVSREEAIRQEEADALAGVYGAARGWVPSEYGPG